MDQIEILEHDGVETVYFHGTTVTSLATLLNPDVPWVWILGHLPNTLMQWWETTLPLNTHGAKIKAECRLVSYDLMLRTQQFMKLLPQFEDHGIVLIQSTQRMPDTLDISRIPEGQQSRVLVKNGALLRMYLPHAVETAQVQCFQKGYLASRIEYFRKR